MSSQNFIRNLGFGPKGYTQLQQSNHLKSIVITGGSIDISRQHDRLQKITGTDLSIICIGDQRSSQKKLEHISDQLIKQQIDRLIVIGGGSILDFAKRIHLNLIESNPKNDHELVAIPSRIGSGAESSMTSIINFDIKKSIKVNSRFMPDTVIYDLELFNTLSVSDIYLGSLDAITHLIESTNSFLSNSYVDFIAPSAVSRYVNFLSDINFDLHQPSKQLLTELCLLSLNGGLAQNNAGAGLCHSLSHSAETILGIPHVTAISMFLKPTLEFMNQNHPESLELFDRVLKKKIFNYIDLGDNLVISDDLSRVTLTLEQLQNITNAAPNDPCWKLMLKRVDKDDLLAYLTEAYELN